MCFSLRWEHRSKCSWREDDEVGMACFECEVYLGHPGRDAQSVRGLGWRPWASFLEAEVSREQSQSGFLVGSRNAGHPLGLSGICCGGGSRYWEVYKPKWSPSRARSSPLAGPG